MLRYGAAAMGMGALLAACLSQAMRESTPAERAEIEAQVRACAMPMRNARWVKIEGLGQWEFGFDTDRVAMNDGSASCIDAVTDRLISPRRLDVMIAYAGSPAAAEGGAR